jgi:multiple sugar transport system ATP-binding protein
LAKIVLEDVTKSYPDGTTAVQDLNLQIRDGEFCVFVGPSGSGKSTALRMIAGLEEISSGTVRIGDRVVNELPPRDRDIAMVFQNYALYPHMTVFENLAFALKLRKMPKAEMRNKVEEAAELLGIKEFLKRKPRQLSGGQRQRVAMGRAIVREPAAFLMDEPLSNLDAKLRVQMRTEIARLHQRLGTTTVYVTHDQVEAVTMADRVAVLRDGVLQQFDTPQNLYERPVNLFVGGFIGSPAMNMVGARLESKNGKFAATFGEHRLTVPKRLLMTSKPDQLEGREVVLGIRPEAFEDPEFSPADRKAQTIEVDIGLVETLGAETIAYFDVAAPPVRTKDALELAADREAEAGRETVLEEMSRAETSTFTARLHANTKASSRQRMKLTVDSERLYLFDPETGKSLDR